MNKPMNERGSLRIVMSSQDAVVVFPPDREQDALTIRVASILPGEVELMFKGNQRVIRDRLYNAGGGIRKHGT